MPGLIIDKVGGGKSVAIEANYNDLQKLVENNSLIPGQKYLVSNYLHKYLINGTDSSFIDETSVVNDIPYNYYTKLESGVLLDSGSKLTIVGLPEGYSGSANIGDIATVITGYGDGSLHLRGFYPLLGVTFSYKTSRYRSPNIDGKILRERFNDDCSGTLTTVEGSSLITGIGSLFTQEFEVGETISYLMDDGFRYDHKIVAINSDTEIEIGANVLALDIATNAAIEKITFGRVMMQPGGLINTDVHNGEAYSGMTAEENPAPQTERLILTAISKNNFSPTAISDTYPGDVIDYDFFDNLVFDLSGNVIATRAGNVIRRKNEALNIDVNKDWRVQRYRRFRCSDKDWNRFKFTQEVYKLDSGSQVYHVGGISRLSFKESKRYLLTEITNGLQYMDFTITNSEGELNGQTIDRTETGNIFTDGSQSGVSPGSLQVEEEVLYGHYYDSLQGMNFVKKNMYTNFLQHYNLNSDDIRCKDYFIIPIENNQPKEKVRQFKVNDLQNSVFDDLPKGQGVSEYIDVIADKIIRSTVLTGGSIRSFNEPIVAFTSLEDFDIKNSGTIHGLINFSSLNLNNKGILGFCQFGGAWVYPIDFVGRATFVVSSDSQILGTIFGVGTTDINPNFLKSSICKDVLMKYFASSGNTISLKGGLFSFGNVTDGEYGGNTWFQRSATHGCDINIHPGFNRVVGIEYMFEGAIKDKNIKTDPISKELYFQKIVEGKLEVEIITSPLKSTDTALSISVDNEVPIVGDNVVFTITTSHVSANPATNVIVNALLPDGYTFVSEDTGNYDNGTGKWIIGDLSMENSKTLNITATVTDTGNYDLAVDLTTKEVEITPEDNTASATTVPTA